MRCPHISSPTPHSLRAVGEMIDRSGPTDPAKNLMRPGNVVWKTEYLKAEMPTQAVKGIRRLLVGRPAGIEITSSHN